MINSLDLVNSHHLYGIGIQAHWSMSWPGLADIQTTFDTFRTLGLKIHITELDINCYDSPAETQMPLTPSLQARLNNRYSELFQLFRNNTDVLENVTFWGVADDHTWLNTYSEGKPVPFRQNYPMPFTTDYEVKDFYVSITNF
jgi:endo-1,4-beta-xylanase